LWGIEQAKGINTLCGPQRVCEHMLLFLLTNVRYDSGASNTRLISMKCRSPSTPRWLRDLEDAIRVVQQAQMKRKGPGKTFLLEKKVKTHSRLKPGALRNSRFSPVSLPFIALKLRRRMPMRRAKGSWFGGCLEPKRAQKKSTSYSIRSSSMKRKSLIEAV